MRPGLLAAAIRAIVGRRGVGTGRRQPMTRPLERNGTP